MPGEILEELNQIRYKKPDEGPKFLLRYALLRYYTSPQGCRSLLGQFSYFINNLPEVIESGRGVGALKVCKLLLNKEDGKKCNCNAGRNLPAKE